MHHVRSGGLMIFLLLLLSCGSEKGRLVSPDEVELRLTNTSGFGTQDLILEGMVINHSDNNIALINVSCQLQDSMFYHLKEEYIYPVNSDFGNTLAAGDSVVFQYHIKDRSMQAKKIALKINRIISETTEPLLAKVKRLIKRIIK